MRKLLVFNSVTLDGYFAGTNGDLSWAHAPDPEWDAFVSSNASGGGEILLGRVTYDLMASYWPTPLAMEQNRVVAEGMNKLPKVVFSRTMGKPSWSNTRLVKGDPAKEIRAMKDQPGPGMVILGSGSIISQLAPEGVIDEYQFVIRPVVLGKGRTMFDGIKEKQTLKLTSSRVFNNGNVLLCYTPMK